MNSLEKVKKIGEIAKFALDKYVQHQNSIVKEYQNIEHHLMKDYEVLVPSKDESYIFDGNVWFVNITNNNIILRKKKTEVDLCLKK